MFFGGATPILPVRDLDASLDYYVGVLGFRLGFREEGFACVSRGKASVFLCQGDQGHPGTWVWIGVGDSEALCEGYRRKGARIRHPPTNYAWACEMQVEDPDGNVLRMGSDSKPGQPFGPWLDMRGRSWVKTADGGWSCEPSGGSAEGAGPD